MTTNESNFKKAIADLKEVKLTSEEKGVLFSKLTRYTEAHQPVADESSVASFIRVVRSLIPISWKD